MGAAYHFSPGFSACSRIFALKGHDNKDEPPKNMTEPALALKHTEKMRGFYQKIWDAAPLVCLEE